MNVPFSQNSSCTSPHRGGGLRTQVLSILDGDVIVGLLEMDDFSVDLDDDVVGRVRHQEVVDNFAVRLQLTLLTGLTRMKQHLRALRAALAGFSMKKWNNHVAALLNAIGVARHLGSW